MACTLCTCRGYFYRSRCAVKNTFRKILCLLCRSLPASYKTPQYAFHTIGEAGLDYTKSVIITDAHFLSDEKPSIESKEFAIIKSEENKIRYGLAKYVNQYKRIMQHHNSALWQHNILTQAADRAAVHPFRVLRKGVVLMSTYEEFMVILTVALLIVAILNMKNK